jgi:hypothetical protein
MFKRTAPILATLALLALPAGAQARSELSLPAARQAVTNAVGHEASTWNAEVAEILAAGNVDPAQDTSTVVSYSTEPCDSETRYRALCDYSERYSDGMTCDLTAEVIRTKRLYVKLPELDEPQDCH